MSGSILDASKVAPPAETTVEVCVVGSGYGGATAAWTLAGLGREVLVLEEGGDFTGSALTGRDGEMYDQLYMDRGGRATSDLGIAVLQGRVLGGGGTINACDVVPLSDEVARYWQTRFGLADFSPELLAPFRRAALDDLSASTPPESELNPNNRIMKRGADALGWRGEVMIHNRVDCAGVGTCLIGCPIDAKKNARMVAIPAALAAGARFITRARVVRIEHASAELKTLTVRRLDSRGYHEGESFTVQAKAVVLAANAIGSAELLLRSGLGNAHVGKHLMLQPQLPVTALFDEEVRFFRGIPQSYAVTEFEEPATEERGWWGFRLEPIAGTPGIVATMIPVLGRAGKELMAQYARFAAALLLVPDDPNGSIRIESSGRMRIDYAIAAEQLGRYRQAVKAAARAYFAAGAKKVLVPVAPPLWLTSEADLAAVDRLELPPATAPLLSAHQQGSVRFAASERDGGADPEGQVWGTRGVYVFDSSGYPSSASSHTMAPIITTSRYLARKLAHKLGA